jgi:hypothetical protein
LNDGGNIWHGFDRKLYDGTAARHFGECHIVGGFQADQSGKCGEREDVSTRPTRSCERTEVSRILYDNRGLTTGPEGYIIGRQTFADGPDTRRLLWSVHPLRIG